MKHHLRSTVGAAVVASALVFSGTAAHAQEIVTDEASISAPAPVETPVPVETAPIEQAKPAPVLPPAVVVPPVAGVPDAGPVEAPAVDEVAPVAPETNVETGPAEGVVPADEEAPESGDAVQDEAELPVQSEEVVGGDVPAQEPGQGEATTPEDLVPGAIVPAPETPAPDATVPAPVPETGKAVTAVTTPEVKAEAAKAEAKPAAAPLPGADLLEFPDGAVDWTEEQWWDWAESGESEKWLDENAEALFYLTETDETGNFIDPVFSDFFDEVAPFFMNGDAEGLLAFLNKMYPNDPLTAQFMAGIVLGLLMEEGLVDADGNPILPEVTEPETEEPVVKPTPEPEEELVVKPVVNIKTPKAPVEKPAAKIKPVKLPAPALAETGADGMVLAGGLGGGLLLLGAGAMVLRRRKNA